MKAFKHYLETKNLSPRTIKAYCTEYMKFTNWREQENIEIKKLDYKHLLQLIRYCRAHGRNRNEVNKQLRSVRLYYDYLLEQGQVTNNPVVGLTVRGHGQRLPHGLFEWEYLESLYQNQEVTGAESQRNKVVLGLLVYQALALEEIEKLESSHLKLREGKIHVPGSARSNGRTLQLEASQILELQEYQLQTREKLLKEARKTHFASGRREINSLFFGFGGGSVDNGLRHYLKSLDPSLNNVKIRGSVISYWLKTKDIRIVQYMAGHKYVSSTERYREMHLEDLQEALKKFHPLNNKEI